MELDATTLHYAVKGLVARVITLERRLAAVETQMARVIARAATLPANMRNGDVTMTKFNWKTTDNWSWVGTRRSRSGRVLISNPVVLGDADLGDGTGHEPVEIAQNIYVHFYELGDAICTYDMDERGDIVDVHVIAHARHGDGITMIDELRDWYELFRSGEHIDHAVAVDLMSAEADDEAP